MLLPLIYAAAAAAAKSDEAAAPWGTVSPTVAYADAAMVSECKHSVQQKVDYNAAAKTIISTADGRCLSSVCHGQPPAGCYPLSFVPCTTPPSPDQEWTYDQTAHTFTTPPSSSGGSSNGGSTPLCLDLSSGGKGTNVGVYRCLPHDPGQQWAPTNTSTIITLAPPPPSGERCLGNGMPPPAPPPQGPFILEKAKMNATFQGKWRRGPLATNLNTSVSHATL